MPTKTKFFFSHSSAHKPFCEDLKKCFEASGHEAWLDAYDIHVGDAIPGTIADGIYNSDYFLLLLTPEVHGSKWVPWELNVATYREVEELGRTFVLPVRRIVCTRHRLVAHKSDIDVVGCEPAEAMRRVLTGLGHGALTVRSLPPEAIVLVGELRSAALPRISTRRLEDALWGGGFPQNDLYSYFPGMLMRRGVSIGRDRVVVGLSEDERETTVELRCTGDIRLMETVISPGPQPILDLRKTARKLAAMIRFMSQISDKLHLSSPELTVKIRGLDRGFSLNYHPLDIVDQPISLKRSFDPITELSATVQIENKRMSKTELLRALDELQSDLFHPVRFPPLVPGGPETSLRLCEQALIEEIDSDASNWR